MKQSYPGPLEKKGEPLKEADMQAAKVLEKEKKAIPPNTFFRSFFFASHGIFYVVRTQRNMQIHLLAGVLVILFGLLFGISSAEWAALLAVMALVYSLEMINTVVEAVVDMITLEYHPLAKIAKDAAAGAVLVAALFAVGVAVAVFVPRLFHFFFK